MSSPNSENCNTDRCILQHLTVEFNTTFGNITSLVFRTLKKNIRIRISQTVCAMCHECFDVYSTWFKFWFAIKALADQVKDEGGSVNHKFKDQRHQDDLSVHRPTQLLYISRCPRVYFMYFYFALEEAEGASFLLRDCVTLLSRLS